MVRAFLAIDLPAEVQKGIGAAVFRWRQTQKGRISWIPQENLHITLVFLGDVPKERLGGIVEACRGVARRFLSAFTLEARGTGVFPHPGRSRVLWIGLSGDTQGLSRLHEAIETALCALGHPREERGFLPHITLGRVRTPRPIDEILPTFLSDGFTCQAFTVREFVLYQSDLSPQGSVYTPIERFPLIPGGVK